MPNSALNTPPNTPNGSAQGVGSGSWLAPRPPFRPRAQTVSTKQPSTISGQRAPALRSSVTPRKMPSSIHGNSRASSTRDTCRQFRPPTSAVQARSNSTTSGTATDKGMNCARMGTATMAAPNPVMPNTTYAMKTTGAARAMRSAGMSRSAYIKVKGHGAR